MPRPDSKRVRAIGSVEADPPLDSAALAAIERGLHGRLQGLPLPSGVHRAPRRGRTAAGPRRVQPRPGAGTEIENPGGWVVETSFRRAIDTLRHECREAPPGGLEPAPPARADPPRRPRRRHCATWRPRSWPRRSAASSPAAPGARPLLLRGTADPRVRSDARLQRADLPPPPRRRAGGPARALRRRRPRAGRGAGDRGRPRRLAQLGGRAGGADPRPVRAADRRRRRAAGAAAGLVAAAASSPCACQPPAAAKGSAPRRAGRSGRLLPGPVRGRSPPAR